MCVLAEIRLDLIRLDHGECRPRSTEEACSSLDHFRHDDLGPGRPGDVRHEAKGEPRRLGTVDGEQHLHRAVGHVLFLIRLVLDALDPAAACDDATRLKVRLTGRAGSKRRAPAIRSDRAPPRFGAGEPPATRDELAIGQRWRRLAGDVAMATVAPVAI